MLGHVVLEVVAGRGCGLWTAHGAPSGTVDLCRILVLGRAELAGGSSGLLQMLLLLSVGVADLDGVVFAVVLDDLVVELTNDLFAVGADLETALELEKTDGGAKNRY